MQSLKKMLLLTSLIIFSGCSGLPDKPKGDLCVIDIHDQNLVCVPISSMTEGMTFEQFYILSKTVNIPLDQADNYVAFSPDTYGNIEKYIKQLENIAKNKCQTSAQP